MPAIARAAAEQRAAAKPLRQRVERAEAEIARLSREIEKLDARAGRWRAVHARSGESRGARQGTRSEHASALAKAEEDWLAAGAALEAATN